MINSSEKLEKFKSIVFSDAEAKAGELLEEVRGECAERVKRAEIEAREFLRQSREATDEMKRTALVRSASAGSLAARKATLSAREELIDRVFAAVEEKLREFTGKPEYEALMKKRLAACLEGRAGKKAVLRVRPADKALAERIAGGLAVETDETIAAGGLAVVFPEENLCLDCTFDTSLEEQRSTAASRIGQSAD